MSPAIGSSSERRRAWPRFLVRIRRAGLAAAEVFAFLGAVLMSVGRLLMGRWPEPAGQDYLNPKGKP